MILWVIIATVVGGAVGAALARRRATEHRPKLLEAGTPLAELVVGFREFAEAVDGGVSIEVDAALKRLVEATVLAPNQSPPPIPTVPKPATAHPEARSTEAEAKQAARQRKRFDRGTWRSFQLEMEANDFDEGRLETLRDWRSWHFTADERTWVFECIDFDDARSEARKIIKVDR